MTVQTIIEFIKSIHTGTLVSSLVIISGIIEISPIKINPWQAIGKLLTKSVADEITSLKSELSDMQEIHKRETEKLNNKIDSIYGDLQNHVAESMRSDILDFQNSCLNRRKHTKEEFTYIYKLCDKYDKYIHDNELSNSEAEEAIQYIRTVYRECLESGAFIIKGEIGTNNENLG